MIKASLPEAMGFKQLDCLALASSLSLFFLVGMNIFYSP
jgi:hypothetical protein